MLTVAAQGSGLATTVVLMTTPMAPAATPVQVTIIPAFRMAMSRMETAVPAATDRNISK